MGILAWYGAWDREAYPAGQMEAAWCAAAPTEADWRAAPAQPLQGGDEEALLRALWDGVLLYLCVELPQRPYCPWQASYFGPRRDRPADATGEDILSLGLDFYGARGPGDSDGRGVISINMAGQAAWYTNPMIPTLGSLFDPEHPESCCRLERTWAEALPGGAGCRLGASFHVEDLEGPILLETELQLGRQTLFWSHRQESLYSRLNHERPDSSDWGVLALAPLPASARPERGPWRIRRALSYLDSPAFQKGVWTEKTQTQLDACRLAAEEALARGEKTWEAALELEDAILALRWGDTRYPDPYDLPLQPTLPDPFRFFGSDARVSSPEDWEKRREELLDLAQFYEYGPRPPAPDSMEILLTEEKAAGDTEIIRFGPWEFPYTYTGRADLFSLELSVGERRGTLGFKVYLPEEDVEQAPVILRFDGDCEPYRRAGFAVVQPDAGSAGDIRSLDYAWGQRSGCFYSLFPYHRNGPEALEETGSEMAAAWCLSRVIDALERLCAPGQRYAGRLDAAKLAVEGFSIHGKYAFVSALYDSRIGVCIPGASGASGLSPWRYVYTGQEYDWTGTPFDCGEAEFRKIRAFGTEVLGNATRHNPVRQRSLFYRFLRPGRAYAQEGEGWGYGLRLPYDQSCLAATLAPRAIVLVNTPNDFNDGSVADALTLEVIAPVYRALGYDPEALLKYNYRAVCPVGDPHGTDEQQQQRTAEFLQSHFLGRELPEDTALRLSQDPFAMKICRGQTASAYDAYWGGFNTVTGGKGGPQGRDGWYYTLPELSGSRRET